MSQVFRFCFCMLVGCFVIMIATKNLEPALFIIVMVVASFLDYIAIGVAIQRHLAGLNAGDRVRCIMV
jgi:hypothetical protein